MRIFFPATLLKHLLIGYLAIAVGVASLVGAHVHLSESHLGPELHAHVKEVHFAHFASDHASLDESHASHATDAAAVDLDGAANTLGLCKLLDIVAITIAMLFLLIVVRTQQRYSWRTTPPPCHPRYSPLKARAPPR